MRRILLTAMSGQLGQELQRTLTPLGEVIGVERQRMDLTQPGIIRQVIGEVKPDLIVNAAAYTAVDKAESEPEVAKAVNEIAPTIMAEEAQQIGAALIHVSTDYVFDGQKNTPYTEQDPPNPVSVYGQSKLAGEEGLRQIYASQAPGKKLPYIILRTAWVYGTFGKSNFVKTMLRLFAERDEVRVVADQVGTPTWARDIAQAITTVGSQIVGAQLHTSPPTGTYHFTNSGVASWYDLAIAVFEEAKELGFPLKVQRIVPITTADYPTPARRPAYSVLSTAKISAVLGTYPSHWRQELRQMLVEFNSYTL